jgi:hypothetical protein
VSQQFVRELSGARQPPGDHENPALAGEQTGCCGRRQLQPGYEVGRVAPGPERALGGAREVDPGLGEAAPA